MSKVITGINIGSKNVNVLPLPRFAMKAAGVGLLVAVIVNLGSAQLPLRPAAVQQRQAPAEWRSTKVSA